jgi:hypothetical protein
MTEPSAGSGRSPEADIGADSVSVLEVGDDLVGEGGRTAADRCFADVRRGTDDNGNGTFSRAFPLSHGEPPGYLWPRGLQCRPRVPAGSITRQYDFDIRRKDEGRGWELD